MLLQENAIGKEIFLLVFAIFALYTNIVHVAETTRENPMPYPLGNPAEILFTPPTFLFGCGLSFSQSLETRLTWVLFRILQFSFLLKFCSS